MGQQEIRAMLSRISELESEKTAIVNELESLKDRVKAHMVSRNASRLLVGEYKVSYTTYTMHRFDSRRFKAENAELYKQYETETEASRFTISGGKSE